MKNRKTVVVAFLLVAAMLLGVGYATLTDTLTITGSATVNQSAAESAFDTDISFKSATPNNTTDTASTTDGSDSATFVVSSLTGKDDTATFTFIIQNKGDLDATVTAPAITVKGENSSYFTATGTLSSSDLKVNGEITYTVTVTLNSTPTDTIKGEFEVQLTATSVDSTTTN